MCVLTVGPRGGNNQREKSSSGRGRGRGRGQDMDPGGAGSGSRSPSRDGSVGGGGQKEKDYNSSSGHPSAGELATFCYRNLDPSNASFVNTIVRRAEVSRTVERRAVKHLKSSNMYYRIELTLPSISHVLNSCFLTVLPQKISGHNHKLLKLNGFYLS